MPLPATHLQSVQTAVKMATASDLSLRGGRRPTWQSREGSYVFAESVLLSTPVLRDCTPRALPRASRSGRHVASLLEMTRQGGAVVHQRPPTVELLPTGRSLSAATGPVGGGCHLNDSLCESFVQHRERHAAPLQWRVRSIPPIIRGGPEWSHSGPLCFTFGYTVQWRGAGGSGSVPAPRHSAHRRCGSRSCPHRAWHRSRCLGRT